MNALIRIIHFFPLVKSISRKKKEKLRKKTEKKTFEQLVGELQTVQMQIETVGNYLKGTMRPCDILNRLVGGDKTLQVQAQIDRQRKKLENMIPIPLERVRKRIRYEKEDKDEDKKERRHTTRCENSLATFTTELDEKKGEIAKDKPWDTTRVDIIRFFTQSADGNQILRRCIAPHLNYPDILNALGLFHQCGFCDTRVYAPNSEQRLVGLYHVPNGQGPPTQIVYSYRVASENPCHVCLRPLHQECKERHKAAFQDRYLIEPPDKMIKCLRCQRAQLDSDFLWWKETDFK